MLILSPSDEVKSANVYVNCAFNCSDLKPENILISAYGHIKVTDFGTAKILPSSPIKVRTNPPSNRANARPGRGGSRKSFVGTAEYVSPEILRDQSASPASDLWAIGCILFQMLSGKTPFKGASEYLIFQAILKCELSFPDKFDAVARDLVCKLVRLEPGDRLGAGPEGISALKEHPFFDGIDFRTLPQTPVPDIPPPPGKISELTEGEIFWPLFDALMCKLVC
jgi:3-phosphoinositide dependent protein kinase-1